MVTQTILHLHLSTSLLLIYRSVSLTVNHSALKLIPQSQILSSHNLHPDASSENYDCYINSCVMVVYENFLKVLVEREYPYNFFRANQRKANSKIYSLTQVWSYYEWMWLAHFGKERIVLHSDWKKLSCTIITKQECIPVGCVPAARRPYSGVSFLEGVSARSRGVSAWSGGWGVCQVRGVCLVWGGGLLRGAISQHALRQTPFPPVDRILDTRLRKYYLGPTSLRPVNICGPVRICWTSNRVIYKVNSNITARSSYS